MVIQIDGGARTNKGGQLMLVAVLQEIKKRFPNAEVIENDIRPNEKLLKQQFGPNGRLSGSDTLRRIVATLGMEKYAFLFMKKFWHRYSIYRAKKGIDLVLDVGGFQFGDQWNHTQYNIRMWKNYLSGLKRNGTKVIFLPQAFGPFEKKGSKAMLEVLNRYADLLIARDDKSYSYLISAGTDERHVALFPDFTNSVKGIETESTAMSKGKVCIIPNNKIFKKDVMEEDDYMRTIVDIVRHVNEKGHEAVLLNHEGEKDFKLCQKIASMAEGIPIITGLNAVETKGVVADSYLVISSRYHGIANALSSGVPCLATSWSHKYKKLLDEFGQGDCLIDLGNKKDCLAKVDRLLEASGNQSMRASLTEKHAQVIAKNEEMWDFVWDYVLRKE
mgnify:FL=1